MSTVLVIPDIHQHLDAANRMLTRGEADSADRIVLLGDLFDDFDDTPADTVAAARWLMAQRERFGEKLIVLIGNHDLPYLEACQAARATGLLPLGFEPLHFCPGYRRQKAEALLKAAGPRFADLWKLHHREDGVLYTHAGANAEQAARLENEAPGLLADLRQPHALFEAGERLGLSGEPGILWRDFAEFGVVPGLPQIFGHTPMRRLARVVANNACIDGAQTLFAVIKDGASLHLRSVDNNPFVVAEHSLDLHPDAQLVDGRLSFRPIHPVRALRRELKQYTLPLC